MNLTYAYVFLVVAIIFELISTSFLKDTNGFTNFLSFSNSCYIIMYLSFFDVTYNEVYSRWHSLC